MSQFKFTLKNVNPYDEIFNTTKHVKPTPISDLFEPISNNKIETITFIDESKHTRKCVIIGNNTKNINCFWCRNTIPKNWKIIKCPISYVANSIRKMYFSEISKNNFSIKEFIDSEKFKKITKETDKDERIINIGDSYYEMFGSFCSFNCCMAFIDDNLHNTMYKYSKFLLNNIYSDLVGESHPIKPAPHWSLLSDYGGILSITEFRDSFNKIEWVNHGTHSIYQNFSEVTTIYEKNILL
jgi:hypothetical protein